MTARCLIILFVLGPVFTGTVIAEPEYLASSAAGLYEIDGESVLRVEGLEGRIMIRAGGTGPVRFLSTDIADRDAEVPVEMWKDGRTLTLRPGGGEPSVAVRMEAAVPPGFSLDILLYDSELTVSNIYGDVNLTGDGLDAKIFNIEGDVTLDVANGTTQVQNIAGDLTLESSAADIQVDGVTGRFGAEVQGGRLQAGRLEGPVELEGDDAEVVLTGNSGELRATVHGGSLSAAAVGLGGEFRLQGTPLVLKECQGDIRVETDAAIGFSDCTADLHFDAYGASIRGTGNQGILEVKTDDADVILRKLNGPTRIQGDRLQVDIQEVGGELWVLGSSSNIKIDNITDPLTVVNEFGDVHVIAAVQKIEVENRDGNVTIERQNGPVSVHADGEQVAVTWTTVNWNENSTVENANGDVSIFLPAKGGCTVDAQATYGRIETDIEEIVVGEDGRSASGSFNRAKRPILRVRAEGDLRIMKAPILE